MFLSTLILTLGEEKAENIERKYFWSSRVKLGVFNNIVSKCLDKQITKSIQISGDCRFKGKREARRTAG